MFKRSVRNFATISLVLVLLLPRVARCQSIVSWFIAGSVAQNGTVKALNVGDTFVAQCKSLSTADTNTAYAYTMAITKSAPAIINFKNGINNVSPTIITLLGNGIKVYDSVNGNYEGYDHILVISVSGQISATRPGRFMSTVFIPFITLRDVGDYYCTAHNGANPGSSAANQANSGFIRITVTTQSSSTTIAANMVISYLAILGAAFKLII